MSEEALRYAYAQARKSNGCPDLTFHDMRHNAASLAGMTGATTAELKAIEGYQHANRTSRPRLAENMSKLVGL